MKIGIIGAGRMGCALALGLKQKGFTISGIYSRNEESARALSGKLDNSCCDSLTGTVKNANVIFIAVPDNAIESVASEIASIAGHAGIWGKTFFHCSGGLTSEVLNPLEKLGGYTGSFHPIQTFADKENGWKGLENSYFGFEGSSEARKDADTIIRAFGGRILDVRKEDKPLYHAAACILSNYLVTLSWVAGNLFSTIGIDHDAGVKALMPLLEKTVKNIDTMGSLNALTGPISRGDYGVVQGHVKALQQKSPGTVDLYKILGRAAVEMALKRGSICEEDSDKLNEVLRDN